MAKADRVLPGCDHHHAVVDCPGTAQPGDDLGDPGGLLSDGAVDTDDTRVALVHDGVHRDGGLAGLAVTDDQFALAPADRYQRVDGHDPGLQRRVDRRAFHDRRSPAFDRPTPDGANPAAFVERAAEGIHDPSQQRLPDRDVHDPAGAAHDLSCPDLHAVLEHDDADPVPVEFQGQPEPPGLELNDLLCADGGQP